MSALIDVSIMFCGRCGSGLVDVRCWHSESVAVLRCSACHHESEVIGFTIGRATGVPAKVVNEARDDMAWPEAPVLRKPPRIV